MLGRKDDKQTRSRDLWQVSSWRMLWVPFPGAFKNMVPDDDCGRQRACPSMVNTVKGDRICETNQEVEADEKWRALALVDPVWLPNHTSELVARPLVSYWTLGEVTIITRLAQNRRVSNGVIVKDLY